ncbi:MAG TPA: hypothetical protein VJ854_00305 [Sphaerochaeta sp.]|nr:hypothetical protein [Sphaerochaeta sp.]
MRQVRSDNQKKKRKPKQGKGDAHPHVAELSQEEGHHLIEPK